MTSWVGSLALCDVGVKVDTKALFQVQVGVHVLLDVNVPAKVRFWKLLY